MLNSLINIIRPAPDRSIQLKNTKLRYTPHTIWIEPTNVCNYKCPHCPVSIGMDRCTGFMDFELYKKIIADIAPFMKGKWVSLHYLGESTLHKQLTDMIALADQKSIKTLFFTNGSLLKKEKVTQLIQAGLKRLTISIDATNKENYVVVQKGGDWDKVIANIWSTIDLKNNLKPGMILTINYLSSDKADYDIKRSELGAIFKNKIDIQGHYFHDWGGYLNFGNELDSGIPVVPCNFLFKALVITWDGQVLPCTHDPNARLSFGNVNDASILELWNSSQAQKLRELFHAAKRKALPDPCRVCTNSTGKRAAIQEEM